jgi:hypothetical protein
MMQNRLNKNLLLEQEVSDYAAKKLNALHYAMDAVLATHPRYLSNDAKKEVVMWLEYQMQALWNFPEQEYHHTHYKRIEV